MPVGVGRGRLRSTRYTIWGRSSAAPSSKKAILRWTKLAAWSGTRSPGKERLRCPAAGLSAIDWGVPSLWTCPPAAVSSLTLSFYVARSRCYLIDQIWPRDFYGVIFSAKVGDWEAVSLELEPLMRENGGWYMYSLPFRWCCFIQKWTQTVLLPPSKWFRTVRKNTPGT